MPTIRLNPGTIVGWNYTDFPGFYDEPVVVGSPPQWADGSDATYAISTAPLTGTAAHASATFEQLPAEAISITSLRIGARFSTVFPNGIGSTPERYFFWELWQADRMSSDDDYLVRFPADSLNEMPAPQEDGVIGEWVKTVYPFDGSEEDPFDWVSYFMEPFKSGVSIVFFALSLTGAYPSSLTVYETWAEVDYETASGRPRVRGYPIRRSAYPGDKRRRGYPRWT